MKVWERLLLAALLVPGGVWAAPAGAGDLAYGTLESFVEFHGLVAQDYYDYQDQDEYGGTSTFNNSYSYLNISCSLDDQLSGIVEWKLDKGGTNIEIDRAYMHYQPWDAFGVILGKFYLPFVLDVRDFRPTGNRLVSDRFTSILAPDLFREIGVEFMGGMELGGIDWTYELAIANGSNGGIIVIGEDGTNTFRETTRDDNENKAVAVRIGARPIEGLEVALSTIANKKHTMTEITSLVPAIPFPVLITSVVDLGFWDTNLVGLTAVFTRGPWEAEAFVIDGAIDTETVDKTDITVSQAQVAYRVWEREQQQLFVAGRFYSLAFDLGPLIGLPQPDRWTNTALGVCYTPQEHLIFKLEYVWKQEEGDPDPEVRNNGLLFQAVLDF